MMVKKTLIIISIIALLLGSILMLSSCGEKKAETTEGSLPVVGVVVQATGELDLFGITTNCWVRGAQGTPILNGDRIKVGPGSGVSILLASGARISAHENSHLQVVSDGAQKSRVALTRGEVWMCSDGAKAAIEIFSSTVRVMPNKGTAPGNSMSVVVLPGGHTVVDVYRGGATLENKSGIVKGKSPGRYEASLGSAPLIVDAEYNLGGTPDENNSKLVLMQIKPFFSDEEKRDEVEEEALAQVEAGSQEPWSYAALAQVRVDRGEFDKAYEILSVVLKIDPYYETALLARGKIELLHSKWREAVNTFKRAKRSARNPVEALFGMAQAYLGLGDLESAEKWYKEVLNAEPEETRALTGLGIVKLLRLQLNEASLDFRQAQAVEPDYIPANIGLATAGLLQGKGDKAGIFLKYIIEKDPKYYEALVTLGVLKLESGKLDSAEAAFRSLEGSDDSRYMSAGYQNHGVVDWVSGRVEAAQEKWTKALDLEKERYPVKVNVGLADLSRGLFTEAGEIFAQLSSLDAADWYPHNLLAITSFFSGSYISAAGEAASAIEYNRLDWPSGLIQGMSLVETDDLNGGKGRVRKSRDSTTDWMPAALDHYLLGFSYEQEKNYERALAEYRKASELFPSEGYYHCRAGMVLALQGNEDEALEEFELALQSKHPYLQASIEIAGIKAKNNDLDEAVQEIESATGRDRTNLELRKEAAEFLAAQKMYDEALRQLQQAREIEGLEPAVVADLLILEGNLLDKDKDYSGASELYEEAVGLDPLRGDAWYYLAVDREKNGNMEQALQAYQQAYLLCAQKPEWAELYQKAAAKLTTPNLK